MHPSLARAIVTKPGSHETMQHFMVFPAALMLESIVSLGVAFFALRMAQGFARHPWRWWLGTLTTSFVVHRGAQALSERMHLDLTYASPGLKLLGMTLPFAGSLLMFMVAPFVIWKLLPDVPLHIRERALRRRARRERARAEDRAGREPHRE